MECRSGCGACCIAPSISSPIPGMSGGKPAGVRCIQLSEDNRCLVFNDPRRPSVCATLKPSQEMCGGARLHAIRFLSRLEVATALRVKQPATVLY
ncbi:MAG: YkgJ family cysteine cluster protein [Acidobacteria bacterium]|nr:YkgJ family cysteine cluster protein [Acidobacteriota bacterium]